MSALVRFKKSSITIIFALGVLVFSIGSLALYAAAPSGGYNPGDTLDPDCAPGDTDCIVAIPAGGGSATATNGLQVIGSDIGLGGLLTEDTTIDGDGNEFVIENGSLTFAVGANIGLGLSGAGFSASVGDFETYIFTGDASGSPITYIANNDVTNDINASLLLNGGDIELRTENGSTQAGIGINGVGGLITLNGTVAFPGYNELRDDSVSTTPINFLYTDGNGNLLSAPTTVLGGGGSATATNGLQVISGDIGLGGVLTETNTIIDGDGANIRNVWFGLNEPLSSFFVSASDSAGGTGNVALEGLNIDIASSEEMTVRGFTASTNGQGQLQIGDYNAPGLGLLTGTSLLYSFQGAGGNNYQSALAMVDAVPFGNVPLSQFSLANTDTNEKTYFQMLDATSLGGEMNIELGYDDGVSDATLIKIQNGQISFTVSSNDTFSIPSTTGSNGYLLQTDGSGVTSWFDPSSFSGAIVRGGAGNNTLTSDINNVGGDDGSGNSHNIFFGTRAGEDATDAVNSIFLGNNAGFEAVNVRFSNIFGYLAGYQATDAAYSNFMGHFAGSTATNANNSNFFGSQAGSGATFAASSNFFGTSAGNGATAAKESNFFGSNAGSSATGAQYSNFFGLNAGNSATNAEYSNFVGTGAGFQAYNASRSVFIGTSAGSGAISASNSIFIGNDAGQADTVDNTAMPGNYSILVGNETSTGGFANSIALGEGATNTATNQFMIGSNTKPIDEIVMIGSGGTSCAIDVNGTACSSDETLKKDISDISNALDIVTQLQGVTYHWIEGSDEALKTPGFIAQDVKDILPEAVRYNENTGKYSMNYTQIIPYLVEAVKTISMTMGKATSAGMEFAGTVIADRFQAREEICIGATCVTESQLIELLNAENITPSTPNIPEAPEDEPVVDNPTDEPIVPEVSEEVIPETPVDTETEEQAESPVEEEAEPAPTESSSEPTSDTQVTE